MSPVAEKKPPSKGSAATHAVRAAIQAHKAEWASNPRSEPRPVLILPEGTTHNGHSLLKFFSGAFEGGGPVQPILLKYPYRRVHSAFFSSTLLSHLSTLLISP